MDDGLIKLIIFVVIGLFIVLGKVLSKKKEGGEQGPEEGQPDRSSGDTAESQSPEEALERMFRQMQERRRRPAAEKPPAAQRQSQQSQQSRPQTLDDSFGQVEEPVPPPAARPAPPVVRPVPPARTYREPAVRRAPIVRRPAPQRVMLRRPKAAFATPEGPTLAAEQRATMAESKVRREAASAQATQGSTKAVQGREDAKAMISLAGAKFDRSEAARAMVYTELLGLPRAMSAYQGPPLAG